LPELFFLEGDFYEEYKKDERIFGEHTGKIIFAMGVDALEQSKSFIQIFILNKAQGENYKIPRSVDIFRCTYTKRL
jgi:hypothetical protein